MTFPLARVSALSSVTPPFHSTSVPRLDLDICGVGWFDLWVVVWFIRPPQSTFIIAVLSRYLRHDLLDSLLATWPTLALRLVRRLRGRVGVMFIVARHVRRVCRRSRWVRCLCVDSQPLDWLCQSRPHVGQGCSCGLIDALRTFRGHLECRPGRLRRPVTVRHQCGRSTYDLFAPPRAIRLRAGVCVGVVAKLAA